MLAADGTGPHSPGAHGRRAASTRLEDARRAFVPRFRPGHVVDAEQGNDYVNVADGRLDSVSCGVGESDTAIVDGADLSEQSVEDFVRLSSCENVTVR